MVSEARKQEGEPDKGCRGTCPGCQERGSGSDIATGLAAIAVAIGDLAEAVREHTDAIMTEDVSTSPSGDNFLSGN